MLAASTAWAYDFESRNLYFNILDESSVEVTYVENGVGNSDFFSGDIVIPSRVTYNGSVYTVTQIGDHAFYYCENITSVSIPNTVTSIGKEAFSNSCGLTSVSIPNSVTTIGDEAFRWCFDLTDIHIPASVTNIGINPFCNNQVTSITVDSKNMFYDSRENCNAIIETATNTLITGCVNTVIPNSVAVIGDESFAFSSCPTDINIPEGVTRIGDYAFDQSGMTSVTIPATVTTIGSGAFEYCTSLTSINIPKGVTTIGNMAFMESGLTSITVDSENTFFDSRNDCNAIIETATNTLIVGCANTIIPNSVTGIGYSAFKSCKGLTSINIPEGVTAIGDDAFMWCYYLTSVTIPQSVTRYWGI